MVRLKKSQKQKSTPRRTSTHQKPQEHSETNKQNGSEWRKEKREEVARTFAEQLIARMKEISSNDWKQGWIDRGRGGIPQSLNGRPYRGGNPFFLAMDAAKHHYNTPVYATWNMILKLNDHLLDKDGKVPEDKRDQIVHVKKGEHSVPVLFWGVSIKDQDGNKITEEEYEKLSTDERNKCDVYVYPKVYSVFNIDQTNMSEVAKDRYQAIIKRVGGTDFFTDSKGMYSNAALDRMFDKQEWLCPIHVDTPRADCYYRPSEDTIYGPMKGQFKRHDEKEPKELYKDGMEFYSSIVHEMAHSTGSPKRLDRETGKRFGDPKYAKEELVAELTAAFTGSVLGFDKRIKDNNTAYVKGWLNSLKEEPEFIFTIMSDVGKASDMILEKVEEQEQKIATENSVQIDDNVLENLQEDKTQAVEQHPEEKHDIADKVAKQMPEEQPADNMQNHIDIARDSRTMDIKPAVNPNEVTDKEVKEFRDSLQDTVRRMKNEGDSDLRISNYLDDLKIKWEESPAMLSAISDAGKMLSEENKKDWYVSVNFLQNSDDTAVFEDLESKDDYKGMLRAARDYDFSAENDWDLQDTFKGSPKHYSGDDIMDEDEDYAIVKNDSIGGTYTIFRRATESEIAEEAVRQGYGEDKIGDYDNRVSDDVKTLVNQMADEKHQQSIAESVAQKAFPVSEPALVDDDKFKLYAVYAMKNGQQEVIKTGLTMEASAKFVERNDQRYQRKGYDYLISMPQEDKTINKSLPEQNATESVSDDAARYLNPEIKEMIAEKNAQEHHTQQHEIQDAMETKKEQEAKQKAAEAQKEAQRQKEQNEKQKQAQEQAKQQQQQQKEQEEKKDSHKSVSSAVVQSTLLITALEFAKAHGGLFLNPSGKAAPQIINSKTSLTPYNQVMLALKSDQEGWRTNAYTFMKPAADAGMPVRKGEKSTPANWVQWSYKNTQTGEVIDSKKFKDIPESDRDLYERTHERKSYPLFNVDQTVMNAKKHDEYVNLLNTVGQRFETIKDFEHNDLAKRTTELMAKLPHTVVLYKNGENIEAYGGSAKKLQKFLADTKGFKTSEVTNEAGKKTLVATFPENRLNANLKTINKNGERITFLENKDMATFIKNPLDTKAVVLDALQDLDKVTRTTGVKMERVMRDVPVEYDASKDTITYSGVGKDDGTLRSVSASVEKANDLYRSLVSATNSESRLDLQHRVNMTPEDAAAHVALVRDMAAGVLMTRHGLPSSLSVDTMNSIDHLINELKENPNKVNLLERGVNTTLEVIDKAKIGRTVDYAKIRGEKSALADSNAMNYSIIRNLQSMPDKDTKEIVVIKDKAAGKADVILPQGASLEANNEAPGLSKVRITKALSKEGISDVTFYNARGGLGLNQPNAYFQGKDITLSKLKQYELQTKKELDVSSAIAKSQDVKIEKFRSIKDDNGKYVFFIKPEGEKSFSVQPSKDDVTKYYDAVRTKDKQIMNTVHGDLEQKYYRIAANHPEYKREVIMPDTSKVDSGKVKIENATITRDKGDNQVYIQAHVDGKFMRRPATPQQWDRMWLADDMQEYKNAVAAVTFAPKIEEKQSESQSQSTEQSQTASVGTSQKEEVKDSQSEDKSDKNALDEGGKSAADDGKTDAPEQSEDKEESEEEEEEVRHGRGL